MIQYVRTTLLLLALGTSLRAQEVSLDVCISNAKTHYPLAKAKEQIDAASLAKLKTIQAQYYPQFDLTGQMTWQNDVPHVAASGLPFQIPTAPKDQYKAYVDVKQLIYDGGTTSAAKAMEQRKLETDKQSLEVELRQAEAGVIQAYFLVLAIDKQMAQLAQNRTDLEARFAEAKAKTNSGVALQSQADLFEVELLRLQQRDEALVQARKAALAALTEYTGMAIGDSTAFTLPGDGAAPAAPQRPELALIEAQSSQLDAAKQLSSATRMPKLAAFGQAGYGNPGFNMLLDSYEPFYMVGVRLNWTVWDWQKSKNDRVALSAQQQTLQQRHETVLTQIKLQRIDIDSRIINLQQALTLDEKMVVLRKNITRTALAQLNAGTITAADYIARLNEETFAQLGLELHKVELAKAKAELNFVMGR